MKKIVRYSVFALLFSGMAVFSGSCSHSEKHDEHEEENAHKPGGDEVVMSHKAFEAAGITFETVATGEFQRSIKCAGVIENSRGAERVISAPSTGIISFRTGLVAGMGVSAGEHLFTISSKGLEQSDATASVSVDRALAEKELRRAEELIKDDLISRKEYERIKADYERAVAQSSTVAARGRAGVGVSSPMGGFLVSVNVQPGSFVNMGDPIAVVAADRRVMLRAELSERYRDFATNITGANIQVPGSEHAISLSALHPRVLTSSAAPADAGHYIPVYIEFDNPGGLGNGTMVEAWLLGSRITGAITVPESALVEEGGSYYVYILEEDDHHHDGKAHDEAEEHEHHTEAEEHEHGESGHEVFRKIAVTRGASDGVRVEILSGLKGGEKVAVTGTLKIRMAGMGSSIQGHSHHH